MFVAAFARAGNSDACPLASHPLPRHAGRARDRGIDSTAICLYGLGLKARVLGKFFSACDRVCHTPSATMSPCKTTNVRVLRSPSRFSGSSRRPSLRILSQFGRLPAVVRSGRKILNIMSGRPDQPIALRIRQRISWSPAPGLRSQQASGLRSAWSL